MVGGGDFVETMGLALGGKEIGGKEIGGKFGGCNLVKQLRRRFCLWQH